MKDSETGELVLKEENKDEVNTDSDEACVWVL